MTINEAWNKAEKRLYELYGDDLDINILSRFYTEKLAFAGVCAASVAQYFEELASICRESIEKYNEKLITKAPVNSSLTAYLLGASELNPLPPHYYCAECKRVEWINPDNDKCLFDMRHTRTCECGAEMRIDGYDIPWQTYLPYAGLKTKDPVPVNNYRDLFEVLCKKHFQYSLFGAGQACNLLEQATGVAPDEIDLNDHEVKHRLLGGGDFSCMHPKLATFLEQAYTVVQPSGYNELLKLIGMAHGTLTWRNNGEDLLLNGECKLSDIPATRDEVFMMIRDAMQKSVKDTGFAFEISEKARRGYYAEHGMDGYTIDTLKNLGFDDWFASYLLGVRYMSTKALSVLELWHIIVLTWYLTYYPKQYAEVIGVESIWEGDT